LEDVALVADTQQNLTNQYSLDIYGATDASIHKTTYLLLT